MIYKSKINKAVILTLGVAEMLLTNAEIVREALGEPVTMSKRVMISVAVKRLSELGYVVGHEQDNNRLWYEPTNLGMCLYEEWRPALRVCRLCDKIAKTTEDLENFVKDTRAKYGRQNLCKNCVIN